MKAAKLLTTLVILSLSSSVFARGYFYSAHTCQIIGNPAQASYHSAGSLIATRNNVRVSCPIREKNNFVRMTVTVFYNTRGAQNALGNKIECLVNKMLSTDQVVQGSANGTGISVLDKLVVIGKRSPAPTVGVNLICIMQRGAKILGYNVINR